MLMKLFGGLCALLTLMLLSGCGENKTTENPPPPDIKPVSATTASGNLDRIMAAKVLRIGIKNNTPPFCFQDSEAHPQGFDVDLGARIARELGVQPVFVVVTSAERIDRLKKGDVDVIIATLTATRKRAHEIDFSVPYFEDTQHLLVKKDSAVQSYKDLAGKKVAALKNSTSILNMKVVAPDCQVVDVDSNDAGLAMLKDGKVDALTGDRLQLLGLKLTSGTPDDYRLAGEGFSVEPYVIGLPRGDSDLRAKIDDALSEIWNKGVWTRLFNKWLGPQTPYNLDASFKMALLPP